MDHPVNHSTHPGFVVESFRGFGPASPSDLSPVRPLEAGTELTLVGWADTTDPDASSPMPGMDELWQFPGAIRLGEDADGGDADINPTVLAMLCLRLLQDTNQDIRQFFMESMFLSQDNILSLASQEKAAAVTAAQSAFTAAVITAAVGLLGGVMQVGTSSGGAYNLTSIKSQLHEVKGLEDANRGLKLDIQRLGSPDRSERSAALAESLARKKADADPTNQAHATTRDAARQQRLDMRADRHEKKASAERQLADNQQKIDRIKVQMDAGTNWAGLLTRAGQAFNATANSAAGAPAAMEEKNAKESTAQAQFLGTEGFTERSNYDFLNGMSQSADGNFRQGNEAAAAIINAVASSNTAMANRMA